MRENRGAVASGRRVATWRSWSAGRRVATWRSWSAGRRVATWRSRSADGTWEQVGENRSQLGLRLVSAWKERPAAARTAAGRG